MYITQTNIQIYIIQLYIQYIKLYIQLYIHV